MRSSHNYFKNHKYSNLDTLSQPPLKKEHYSNNKTDQGEEEDSQCINVQLGNEGHQNLLELLGKPTIFASKWCSQRYKTALVPS